ncbi:hypothetical protein FOA52_005933 [Chlamydomonas sp. UWO 241]|nr:hypothetical protein FOA52_005933 [Chlamydomonas sp. UWO 241]
MDGPSQGGGGLVPMFQAKANQRLQVLLDRSAPHIVGRWVALVCMVALYVLRTWYLSGFYIITYGLGIYNLNLVLGFLTPVFGDEGPVLPTSGDASGEFKPFVRRLPEMKFWWSSTKSVLAGFLMTFFSVFDVPVFWPILLMYWFILFFVTMKRQIMHMIKHKYLPFSMGKKTYKGTGKVVAKDSK